MRFHGLGNFFVMMGPFVGILQTRRHEHFCITADPADVLLLTSFSNRHSFKRMGMPLVQASRNIKCTEECSAIQYVDARPLYHRRTRRDPICSSYAHSPHINVFLEAELRTMWRKMVDSREHVCYHEVDLDCHLMHGHPAFLEPQVEI